MIVLRRLVLGGLDLTDYPLSVEFGGDLGSPENVYDVLVSLLSDGEISTSDRVSNRTITFSVLVEGATLAELAQNEAALIAECDKARNTLTIDPGDDYAAPSVFDVFRVQATLQYDDNLEQSNFRRYQLTIPAWPYARGADLVTTPAQGAGTETVIDDGSSAANWSADYGGVVTTAGGAIVDSYLDSFTFWPRLIRTASVNLSAYRYLAVKWASSTPTSTVTMILGGSATPLPEVSRTASGGWTTTFHALPEGTGTVGRLDFYSVQPFSTGAQTFSIDQVSGWTAIPFIGTARQKAMAVIPGGAVHTQGSVRVRHASNALGQVILYTTADGYLPTLRTWRTSGNTVTSDSSRVSGAREPIGPSSTVFRVPVSALPVGRVELWAWLRVTSGSLTRAPAYAIRSIVNGVTLASSGGNFSTTFTALNTWQLVSLGALTSPPIDMGPSGLVQIDLNDNSGQVEIDEAYLFATDHGSLTVVDCGTGTPSSGGPSRNLWIDAPSLEQPMGAIYRGHADDRSDAWHAGGSAVLWGTHDFDPAGTSVFVVTSGTIDADTSLEHYRRYHTHAAE